MTTTAKQRKKEEQEDEANQERHAKRLQRVVLKQVLDALGKPTVKRSSVVACKEGCHARVNLWQERLIKNQLFPSLVLFGSYYLTLAANGQITKSNPELGANANALSSLP